jgi:hypothetical protein
LEFVGQPFVIDSHEMQQGCVQVVDIDRIADNVVTEFAGLPVMSTGFDATPGQPDAEAAGMMVSAEIGRDFSLTVSRTGWRNRAGARWSASTDDESGDA